MVAGSLLAFIRINILKIGLFVDFPAKHNCVDDFFNF